MHLLRNSTAFFAASLLAAVPATPALAESVADFYRGKRVSIVVGYASGGGYDTYARLLARFIGEHIPGNPTIIPQNMPGAASRGAANWIANVAPRDGTALAMLSQSTPTDQALGQPGIKFDVRRLNWIGNMVVVNNILFVWTATGVRSLNDVKVRQVAVGSTGASSPSMIYPQVSNNLLGTHFKIVTGYPGGSDINLAVQRGEIDGRGSNSWASLKANNPDWISERKVTILFQIGLQREAELDAPLWRDFAKDDEQRQILDVISGDVSVGRPILTAPDVPPERVSALRKAFDDTLKDPRFLATADQAKMYMNPMRGEQLQRIVGTIVNASPEVIAKVKDVLRIRDSQELPPDKRSTAGPQNE